MLGGNLKDMMSQVPRCLRHQKGLSFTQHSSARPDCSSRVCKTQRQLRGGRRVLTPGCLLRGLLWPLTGHSARELAYPWQRP